MYSQVSSLLLHYHSSSVLTGVQSPLTLPQFPVYSQESSLLLHYHSSQCTHRCPVPSYITTVPNELTGVQSPLTLPQLPVYSQVSSLLLHYHNSQCTHRCPVSSYITTVPSVLTGVQSPLTLPQLPVYSQVSSLLCGLLVSHLLGAVMLVEEDDNTEDDDFSADSQEWPEGSQLVYNQHTQTINIGLESFKLEIPPWQTPSLTLIHS